MGTDLLGAVLQSAVIAALPLLLAGLGELVSERSGVVNLGVEGTMLTGASVAFAAMTLSHNVCLALLAGVLAGLLMGALFGFCTLKMLTSQIPTGMAITAFGVGLSAYIGKLVPSQPMQPTANAHIPLLSDIPVVGVALFSLPWVAYAAMALCVLVWWFLSTADRG